MQYTMLKLRQSLLLAELEGENTQFLSDTDAKNL